MFSRETIQKNMQTYANNTFTHCASTTINNSTTSSHSSSATKTSAGQGPSSSSTSGQPQQHTSSSLPKGAIIGIAVGAAAALSILISLLVRSLRKQRNTSSAPDEIQNSQISPMEQRAYQIEPYQTPAPPPPPPPSTGVYLSSKCISFPLN